MTFTTRLDHGQRLAIFHWTGSLSQDDLSRNLKVFRRPDFPAHYDIMNLFDPAIVVEIDHESVVGHAIERHRTLLERDVGRQLRSAFIAVPDSLKSLVELWPLFFPEADKSLLIQIFDTLEEALVWLERDSFDETSLEAFPPRDS